MNKSWHGSLGIWLLKWLTKELESTSNTKIAFLQLLRLTNGGLSSFPVKLKESELVSALPGCYQKLLVAQYNLKKDTGREQQ